MGRTVNRYWSILRSSRFMSFPAAYPEVGGKHLEILNPPVTRVVPHSAEDLRCVCHVCIWYRWRYQRSNENARRPAGRYNPGGYSLPMHRNAPVPLSPITVAKPTSEDLSQASRS